MKVQQLFFKTNQKTEGLQDLLFDMIDKDALERIDSDQIHKVVTVPVTVSKYGKKNKNVPKTNVPPYVYSNSELERIFSNIYLLPNFLLTKLLFENHFLKHF